MTEPKFTHKNSLPSKQIPESTRHDLLLLSMGSDHGTHRGGNLASVGRLYRDGFIDGFMLRALLSWMGYKRFTQFDYRWRVHGGDFKKSRRGMELIARGVPMHLLDSELLS